MLLSSAYIQDQLQNNNPEWSIISGNLYREFMFINFTDAFAFMTAIALEAEKADHHPDWQNVYNKVVIKLSTHSAGGITEKDLALAEVISEKYRYFTS